LYYEERELIMKKNKLLGFAIAAIMTMSTIVPAFGAETTTQDLLTSGAQIEAQQVTAAQNLGLDLTGLSTEDAQTQIDTAI
jgi:hypothetical protein